MNAVESVYGKGYVALVEQFTLKVEELRLFVVVGYYDENEELLYTGASKDFYNYHYNTMQRLNLWEKTKYVAFQFYENEKDMWMERKRALRDKSFFDDALVLNHKEMVEHWQLWLS